MNIFICTFFIKLNSVKVKQIKRQSKRFNTILTASIKNANQQVIAISPKKPIVINGTAWFNQKFQIKSDIVYDPTTKKGKESIILFEIIRQFQNIKTYHKMVINLFDLYQKKAIQERLYKLDGGGWVEASLQMSCMQNINETVTIAKIINKTKKLSRQESKSKVRQQDIRMTGQFYQPNQKINNLNTPSFGINQNDIKQNTNFKQMEIIYEAKMSRMNSEESPSISQAELIKKLQMQLNEQKQRNKRCKQKIDSLINAQINNTAQIETLLSQIQSSQNLNAQLQAKLCNKQTQLVQLTLHLQSIQKDHLQKKIEKKKQKDLVQTQKVNNQHEISKLREEISQQWKKYEASQHMIEIYKFQLHKQKEQNDGLITKIQRYRKQNESLLVQIKNNKQMIITYNNEILGLKQVINQFGKQNENIKKQAKVWRSQFAAQQQRKHEQLVALQQKYQELFKRYSQMIDSNNLKEKVISKALYVHQVQFYEAKLAQYQQKQEKLRKEIKIIEEQMSNTYEILEEKEDIQQVLIQNTKKLQYELQILRSQRQFWHNLIPNDNNQENGQFAQANDHSQEVKKLQQKNNKIVKMLITYSKGIMQKQKSERQLSFIKKKFTVSQQKVAILKEQLKQLKEKISVLMKQNKKLLDKNYKITKQSQIQAQRTKRLQYQLQIVEQQLKQVKYDYDILAYQIKNNKKNQINNHHLSKSRSISSPILALKQPQELIIPKLQKKISVQNASFQQNSEIYLQTLTKLLQQRKKQNEKLNKHINDHLQQKSDQKKLNLQKQLKNIELLMSRMKKNMVKSGNQKLIRDLQLSIKRISSQFQSLIIKI